MTRAQRFLLYAALAIAGATGYAWASVEFGGFGGAQSPTVAARTVTAKTFFAPTPCTPREQLFGRDTMLAYVQCNDTSLLEPHFRAQVRCTLRRMSEYGKWDKAIVFESFRSHYRQAWLYSYGRTRPGPRVTNASSALTSPHGYGLGADIVHSKSYWDNPKFFKSLAMHAEACGAVAGAYWKRFPDKPHVQAGIWEGAPPLWARDLSKLQGYQAVWPLLVWP